MYLLRSLSSSKENKAFQLEIQYLLTLESSYSFGVIEEGFSGCVRLGSGTPKDPGVVLIVKHGSVSLRIVTLTANVIFRHDIYVLGGRA